MSDETLHESLGREHRVEGSSDRSFGLVFAGFFGLMALWPLLRGAGVRWWAVPLAAAFGAVALLRPGLLAPLNRWWLRLGLLLSRVVTPVVMGLLFFTTVTPVGLAMRAFGKDPLRRRFDAAAKSYWIEREPPGPAPETMSAQF